MTRSAHYLEEATADHLARGLSQEEDRRARVWNWQQPCSSKEVRVMVGKHDRPKWFLTFVTPFGDFFPKAGFHAASLLTLTLESVATAACSA